MYRIYLMVISITCCIKDVHAECNQEYVHAHFQSTVDVTSIEVQATGTQTTFEYNNETRICRWKILNYNRSYYDLVFIYFESATKLSSCKAGGVLIRDLSITNHFDGPFCGDQFPQDRLPFLIRGDALIISTSFFTMATMYELVTKNCAFKQTFRDGSSTFESPNYPRNYAIYDHCLWSFPPVKDLSKKMFIVFFEVILAHPDQIICKRDNDALWITQFGTNLQPSVPWKLCTMSIKKPSVVTLNSSFPTVVKFHSNGVYGTAKGFSAQAFLADSGILTFLADSDCSELIQTTKGRIQFSTTTPKDCLWLIYHSSLKPNLKVFLIFESLLVKPSRFCSIERIEVLEQYITDVGYKKARKYCDMTDLVENQTVPYNNDLALRFVTTTDTTRAGFVVKYMHTSENCGSVTKVLGNQRLTIKSPGYPFQNYSSDLMCSWYFYSDYSFKFELDIVDIRLDNVQPMLCMGDFVGIQIGDDFPERSRRVCSKMKLTDTTHQLSITFDSNSHYEERGFLLLLSFFQTIVKPSHSRAVLFSTVAESTEECKQTITSEYHVESSVSSQWQLSSKVVDGRLQKDTKKPAWYIWVIAVVAVGGLTVAVVIIVMILVFRRNEVEKNRNFGAFFSHKSLFDGNAKRASETHLVEFHPEDKKEKKSMKDMIKSTFGSNKAAFDWKVSQDVITNVDAINENDEEQFENNENAANQDGGGSRFGSNEIENETVEMYESKDCNSGSSFRVDDCTNDLTIASKSKDNDEDPFSMSFYGNLKKKEDRTESYIFTSKPELKNDLDFYKLSNSRNTSKVSEVKATDYPKQDKGKSKSLSNLVLVDAELSNLQCPTNELSSANDLYDYGHQNSSQTDHPTKERSSTNELYGAMDGSLHIDESPSFYEIPKNISQMEAKERSVTNELYDSTSSLKERATSNALYASSESLESSIKSQPSSENPLYGKSSDMNVSLTYLGRGASSDHDDDYAVMKEDYYELPDPSRSGLKGFAKNEAAAPYEDNIYASAGSYLEAKNPLYE